MLHDLARFLLRCPLHARAYVRVASFLNLVGRLQHSSCYRDRIVGTTEKRRGGLGRYNGKKGGAAWAATTSDPRKKKTWKEETAGLLHSSSNTTARPRHSHNYLYSKLHNSYAHASLGVTSHSFTRPATHLTLRLPPSRCPPATPGTAPRPAESCAQGCRRPGQRSPASTRP